MARGGRRQGRPGANYAQRSDLRVATAAGAQDFGEKTALAQQASALPTAAQGQQSQPIQPQQQVFPGELPALDRPSERPWEPVTAGSDVGPGSGSEALVGMPMGDQAADRIRAIYQRFPSEGLRELIENLDD